MAYRKFAFLIRAVGVLCILLGVSVIAGWLLNVQFLKSVAPALPTMKFNTAICFLLSGISFLLVLSEKQEYIKAGKILSIITFSIATISFSQDIFGYRAGIDQLFVTDIDTRFSDIRTPGRMSATTAFSFMNIGLAFYLIRSNSRKQKIFSQFALHLVSAIALLAIIGYLYNVPDLYTLSFFSSMALHTSVFLFLLSVAASYINYSLGITGLFTGDKTGNAMARKLFPLSALLLVLLSLLRIELNRFNMVTADFSIALFALSFLFVSLLLIAITAKQLNKIDRVRYNAQENLKTANANLEKTIAERTALLKHTSDTLQLAATAASIGIWEIDLNTGIIQGNNILHDILEIEASDKPITTAQMQHLVHAEDRRFALQNFHLAESGEKELDFEHRIIRHDNSLHYIKVKGVVEKDVQGKPQRILGAHIDITPQKLAEQQIRESYNRIKTIVEDAPLAIAMFDDKMQYLAASNYWIENYNLKGKEILGKTQYEVFPELGEGRKPLHNKCLSGETIKNDGEKFVLSNGKMLWLSWVMCPWYIAEGKVGGIIISSSDITNQKEQMEELRISRERYHSMVNAVQDYAIYSLDTEGHIQNWNKGAENITGYNQDEIIGKHFSIFYTENDIQKNLPALLLKQLKITGHIQYNGWRKRKDGSTFKAMVSITALHNAKNDVIGFSEVIHDLTLREAEAEARKYTAILEAKNKEMEQFVYIASHDLQEPLRTISNFIQVIEEDHAAELGDTIPDYLNAMKKASSRMNSLIIGLLEYSRLGRNRELISIDCNKLLNDVTDDLTSLIHNTNTLILAPVLPTLNGYEKELRQLFQNLVSNAIKFRKDDVPPEIEISCEEKDDFWEFSVKDNGIGIDNSHYEKIFFIFQRLHLKDEYEGSGIGLANCKKIVELHGGKIWVDSTPGEGSTFYFTLAKQYK